MTDPQETPTTDAAPDTVAPDATPVADAAGDTVVEATPAAAPRAVKRQRAATPQLSDPYAIIETGGKQYRVSVGDVLSVEKLESEPGADVTFDRVLLVGGDGATRVGTPVVEGASVVATVQEQYRGEKIVVFKYKPKKRYRRKTGHRQSLTRLAVTAINA